MSRYSATIEQSTYEKSRDRAAHADIVVDPQPAIVGLWGWRHGSCRCHAAMVSPQARDCLLFRPVYRTYLTLPLIRAVQEMMYLESAAAHTCRLVRKPLHTEGSAELGMQLVLKRHCPCYRGMPAEDSSSLPSLSRVLQCKFRCDGSRGLVVRARHPWTSVNESS